MIGQLKESCNLRGVGECGVVSRRLELKLEGLGFSQAEIVKELSQKLKCSERTVYYDFESRADWQPIIQSVVNHEAVLLKAVNCYEQIYRQASVRLLTASNELAQLGALNTMLKAKYVTGEYSDGGKVFRKRK